MANLITLFRIIGVFPLILLVLNGSYTYAFIIFIILGLTDFLDGYVARHYSGVTDFGKIMDGVADKFLMISITICLLIKNIIPYWTLLIFIRDVSSCVFALYYIKKTRIVIKSNIYGKLKTTLHIISIAFVLLFGRWQIVSSVVLIIAILLFLPEIVYIKKLLNKS